MTRLTACGLAGAGALALLAAAGCGSSGYTRYGPGAEHPPPAPPLGPVQVRALHLADFGDPDAQQAAVARAVAASHRRAPFDLALFPGDNIYEDGPDPGVAGADACRFAPDGNGVAPGFAAPADPSFARHEAALAPLAGVPIYLALGNHDVHAPPGASSSIGRLKACLEVAHTSPAWQMPARHYVVDRGPARFIVIDSNLVPGDYAGFALEDEVDFVARAAAGCADRLCFLVGHHPPVTAGEHAADATASYLGRMGRLLAAGGGRIRAYLSGHDHDLQHLRMSVGGGGVRPARGARAEPEQSRTLDVLVSGNGSRARPQERFGVVSVKSATLEFASVRWGLGVLSVSADGWAYRFEDVDGRPLHCCAAVGTGPCAPVQCAP